MRVTLLLADAAQLVDGKLYLLGGGWQVRRPVPIPWAIVVKIEVPWDQTNMRHSLRLELVDEDGHSVRAGNPIVFHGEFEVGRPPGTKPGAWQDAWFVLNLPPLPLPPNQRFVWRCYVNERAEDGWQVAFHTAEK